MVTIEENYHDSERQEYINLARDFLENKITAEDFSYSFMGIYTGIHKKVEEIAIEESLELANFLTTNNPCGLNELLSRTYGSCDSFSLDLEISLSDESELRSYAQTLLLKLKKQ